MRYITEVIMHIISDEDGLREVKIVKYKDITRMPEEEEEENGGEIGDWS